MPDVRSGLLELTKDAFKSMLNYSCTFTVNLPVYSPVPVVSRNDTFKFLN